tara:strand:+ start:23456 stop:23716 length:261 start_codon:yes stop_codon:yes gene_type:complete
MTGAHSSTAHAPARRAAQSFTAIGPRRAVTLNNIRQRATSFRCHPPPAHDGPQASSRFGALLSCANFSATAIPCRRPAHHTPEVKS